MKERERKECGQGQGRGKRDRERQLQSFASEFRTGGGVLDAFVFDLADDGFFTIESADAEFARPRNSDCAFAIFACEDFPGVTLTQRRLP